MSTISSDRIASIEARKHELQQAMSRSDISPDEFVRLSKDYAAIEPVAQAAREVRRLRAELEVLNGMVADPTAEPELKEMAATEAEEIRHKLPQAERALAIKLLPRDAADDRAAMLEVRAGTGGDEAALFAGDLLRMYLRYAERHGWVTEVLDEQESDLGGFKDVAVAIKTKGVPEGGFGVWSRLKWEGGVHRVQRVPVTESQGRIHTSAAGVLVTPEAEETEVEINESDLRVDVFRSSGPGGQSVNTTDSAVRITHLPTGIVVSCQNERSQLQNKDRAMRMLRAKLTALAEEQAAAAAGDARRSQVRTVDRSERIRTYNFPQNRITDHRIGYTAYNLDLVLAGDLDDVLNALGEADRKARLTGEDQLSRA
jgi:peptide chain release factor 1